MGLFRIIGLITAAVVLAACEKTNDFTFQGWVEADMIYVGPDEAGRLDSLNVREGDSVETGSPLFAVDPELQQADVDTANATLAKAARAIRGGLETLVNAHGKQAG
jgi:HlyD family secretion protein